MTPARVLFVDDEPQVLDGLRNVLHRQRRVWKMSFACGGEAALETLESQPHDVIVTDMRMAGMDGADLLNQVRERYPSVARIVLSGHAETGAVFKALGVAHQYLSKPCDVDRLISVVGRAAGLQAFVHNDSVRRVVSGLGRLPSVPRTYLAITDAASKSWTSLDDITTLVERDTALVAKVLQIVNSAYFGLPQQSASIRQAIQYLGIDTLRGLALAGEVFGADPLKRAAGVSIEELQAHSEMTARLARLLAPTRAKGDGNLFAAAMVHDIGHIVLASAMPKEIGEIRRTAVETERPLHEVELECLGGTHAEIGAYLLGLWGLPLGIVEATAYHHRPGLATPEQCSVLAVVYLADVLLESVAAEEAGHPAPIVDTSFVGACGIEVNPARWRDLALEVAHPA